jgi:acyl carrier protein
VEASVLRVVRELTGALAISLTIETPLMDAGIDSLAATELSSRLRLLTGVALSPTIVFEEPTPRAIAAHLLEQVSEEVVGATPTIARAANGGCRVDNAEGPVAIIGLVGRWPGGCDDEARRWCLQATCGDAMGKVPSTRWVIEEAVDMRLLSSVQTACVQHGGFVAGAERFDGGAFGISPAEAGAMDPQQRLLLELGYGALHASCARRATLMGGDGGVFLGIERPDWAVAQPPSARSSVYAVTGDNVSAAAGRVSFVLGLQGPCSSVDTACASALSAVHGGAHAILGGECGLALALAVGLKLVPYGALGGASAVGRWAMQDARRACQWVRKV